MEDGDKATEEERNLSARSAWLEGMRDLEFWGIWMQISDASLTDISIMLPLTDFTRCLYLENKPTQKICDVKIWFSIVLDTHTHTRKRTEDVALFLPPTPLETCDFGSASKFIQWELCYSSTPIKVGLVRMLVITIRKTASSNLRRVNTKALPSGSHPERETHLNQSSFFHYWSALCAKYLAVKISICHVKVVSFMNNC